MTERSASFRRLGDAFAAGGERYDRLRPGYPPEAVAWLVDGVPEHGTVVDVGSGTGKLAATLVSQGLEVIAVDPSDDMLAQLSRRVPTAQIRVGRGEATGLPDGTADLATFAQSWHWVEPTEGVTELLRILKPGGRAGWVWNFMDTSVSWVSELGGIWHTVASDEVVHATRHRPELQPPFGPVESTTIAWECPMSLTDLADLVTTRSYYLSATPSEQKLIKDEVDRFLAATFPGRIEVALPYLTHCFRATVTV